MMVLHWLQAVAKVVDSILITYLSLGLHNQTRRFPTALIRSVSIAVTQEQKTLARKAYLILALQGQIAAS